MKKKILLSWSGGKDSTFALYKLLQQNKYEIISLYTTLSHEFKRINFHGVTAELLDQQAQCLGFELDKVFITRSESTEEYAQKLENSLVKHKKSGITTIAYGDIFLEDLRNFRIQCLKKIGMKSIYPIWKTNTKENIREFIDLGFKAIITCIDSKVLDKSFLGRIIDDDFIKDLPGNVDFCGENGEFHSFVFDGPIFKKPVKFLQGEIVFKEGFYLVDLISQELSEMDKDLATFIQEENIEKIKTLNINMQKEVLELYKECKKIDLHFEIVSAWRSFEEEENIYYEYRDICPHQICIPGGGSHEKGIAIDIKIDGSNSYSTKYDKIAEIWKRRDNVWGQDINDEYWHFAMKNKG